MRNIKYSIVDKLFGEDMGDLIYSLEIGDYKSARKIVRFFQSRGRSQ